MFMNKDPEKEAIKKQQIIINKLLKRPENKFCADCKDSPPSWASINLGVFVCIKCSGCHRELGTHISKIKSINLDTWSTDILDNFRKINNEIANKYWEYNLQNYNFDLLKNNRHLLMDFIRDKYEHKKWVNQNDIDPMTKIMQGININKVCQKNNSNNLNNQNYMHTNFNQNNQNNNNCNGFNNSNNYNNINFNCQKNNQMNNNNNIFSFYNPNYNNCNNCNNINSNKVENNNSFGNFNWNYFNQNTHNQNNAQ